MGISSDAMIVYGVPLEGESEPPGTMTDEQWEEACWAYGEDWEAQGFEVVQHCSDGYPMYILAVPGSRTTAFRGDTIRLNPYLLSRIPAGIEAWRNALIGYGIDTFPEGWYLCSFTDAI